MKIKDRDHARELIALTGVTSDNVSNDQLHKLWHMLNMSLESSGLFSGKYRMNRPSATKFMKCSGSYFEKREAISFNMDGFIGFAGWADDNNVRPILDAVGEWVEWIQRGTQKGGAMKVGRYDGNKCYGVTVCLSSDVTALESALADAERERDELKRDKEELYRSQMSWFEKCRDADEDRDEWRRKAVEMAECVQKVDKFHCTVEMANDPEWQQYSRLAAEILEGNK